VQVKQKRQFENLAAGSYPVHTSLFEQYEEQSAIICDLKKVQKVNCITPCCSPFFFVCPKKKQKKAHENDYCPFSWLFPDSTFVLL